jgi:hypothetical protein
LCGKKIYREMLKIGYNGTMETEVFSIKTEVFEGPLPLLLHLIQKRKLFINDISLASVADEYIEGNFIVNGNILAQNVVYTTGTQTISGVKNFSSRPTLNGTGLLLSGEAYPLNNPSGYVQSRPALETSTSGISGINNIVYLSQATYDALSSKLSTTLYLIV